VSDLATQPEDLGPSGAELERAVRLLAVRSRREVSSAFAGGYRSAFRGGGIEFEESRPYLPGDDVRALDWNAMARSGVPYVKRFREERDQTVVLAIDVSASMRFGSVGRAKAALAAHAAALTGAAAGRAGDRVGLLSFDTEIRDEIPAARGEAHTWRILRTLVAAAGRSAGGTQLETVMARLRASFRRRAVVFVFSDFRDERFFGGATQERTPRTELVALARSHDLVAVTIHDPREEAIPDVGIVRLRDPEAPHRVLVFDTRSERARARYQAACAVRRRALERRLRADGADTLALRTDRDPLHALTRFFHAHPGRHRGARS
jgi:uncharacterized protein (DUF58 family)